MVGLEAERGMRHHDPLGLHKPANREMARCHICVTFWRAVSESVLISTFSSGRRNVYLLIDSLTAEAGRS